MITKEVTITKKDLLLMQILLMFRATYNRRLLAIFFVCSLAGGYNGLLENGFISWISFSLIVTTFGFIGLILIGSAIQALAANPEKGTIGDTRYTLTAESFTEDTGGTSTESKWAAIRNIYFSKNYIFVEVGGLRIHIIPKREFKSEDEYDSFLNIIQQSWNRA